MKHLTNNYMFKKNLPLHLISGNKKATEMSRTEKNALIFISKRPNSYQLNIYQQQYYMH